VLAIASELLAALPAQPPSALAIASRTTAVAAHDAVRLLRNKAADACLISQSDIVKIR
jgi:hypothetical protein